MKVINKKELSAALVSVGWAPDKYGHLQKDINVTRPFDGFPHGKTTRTPFRIRLEDSCCFVETKKAVTPTAQNPSRTAWVVDERIYYTDVIVTAGGQIKIGSRHF